MRTRGQISACTPALDQLKRFHVPGTNEKRLFKLKYLYLYIWIQPVDSHTAESSVESYSRLLSCRFQVHQNYQETQLTQFLMLERLIIQFFLSSLCFQGFSLGRFAHAAVSEACCIGFLSASPKTFPVARTQNWKSPGWVRVSWISRHRHLNPSPWCAQINLVMHIWIEMLCWGISMLNTLF